MLIERIAPTLWRLYGPPCTGGGDVEMAELGAGPAVNGSAATGAAALDACRVL